MSWFTYDGHPIGARTDCDNCGLDAYTCNGIFAQQSLRCCRTCQDLSGSTHREIFVQQRALDYTPEERARWAK